MNENEEKNNDNHIKIFLRLKPKDKCIQNNKDDTDIDCLKISKDNKSINLCLSKGNESQFIFDKIFDIIDNQKNIFNEVALPLCTNVLDGYNSTIVFYGKKSTGKTYTLLGKSIYEIQKEFQENGNHEVNNYYNEYLNNKGVLINAMEYIFNNILLNSKYNNFSFNISMSYVDVFDNHIFDYFNLENFEDENRFNFNNLFKKKDISNLDFIKLNVSNIDEALFYLNQGREIKKTIFNEIKIEGIKGHSIITLFIEKINEETNQIFKSSFNFVELSSSYYFNNNNHKYNISVNKSLETFSYVINQLIDNVKRENIIYNNSILTYLLKDSFGGNSKTSMIVNISPLANNILDTFQSVSFTSKIRSISNNPKVNEVKQDDINHNLYNELIAKNEGLKSEKNYLLSYLGKFKFNYNIIIENDKEKGKKKISNQNQKKKEKDENLNKFSKKIKKMDIKIEQINADLTNLTKNENILKDKYNKVDISLFLKNKDIQNKEKDIEEILNKKKDTHENITIYENKNISSDSLIFQKDLQIKEAKLKNNEEINKYNQEINSTELQIKEKENSLKNMTDKYNNLLEENKLKNNMQKDLEEIKKNLGYEKVEKQKKIDENKIKYDNIINKSEDIKQKIIDKNFQYNTFQKNLDKYDEYEMKTINDFKKLYDNKNKNESYNNNKFFDFQKNLPEKEKELKKINAEIDDINSKKIGCFDEQEKIKEQILNYDKKYKNLEKEKEIYKAQVDNFEEKISILTLNLNPNVLNDKKDNDEGEVIFDKNNEINSSIFSFEFSTIKNNNENFNNNNGNFYNDFVFDEKTMEQLRENKKKLLDFEQRENNALNKKKNKINNEIYKFKISHLNHNLVNIEENIEKINEKEQIIKNYQNFINLNYNLINDYLKEEQKEKDIDNNNNDDISITQFTNLFNKFIEKFKKVDEEFELVKNEFKENGVEYRETSKEAINTSLKNNPLLKNYEEIYKNSEDDNQIKGNIKDDIYKRITMNNNRILSDTKNLTIYNRIYPNKRKLNDYQKIVPEFKQGTENKKIIAKNVEYMGEMYSLGKTNINLNNLNNEKDKDKDKENNINNSNNISVSIANTTTCKTIFGNKREKLKQNKFLCKSPDKNLVKGIRNYDNLSSSNSRSMSNINYKYKYKYNNKSNKTNKNNNELTSLLKGTNNKYQKE